MTPNTPSDNYRNAEYSAGPNEGVVVDLSMHAEKLVAYEDISHLLTEEQERRIVDYVKSMLDMSHSKIRRRYDHWKEADRAHDVYVPADAVSARGIQMVGHSTPCSRKACRGLRRAAQPRCHEEHLDGGAVEQCSGVFGIADEVYHQAFPPHPVRPVVVGVRSRDRDYREGPDPDGVASEDSV